MDSTGLSDKEALANAKRSLLLRFIKDQESLQTSQADELKPCDSSDATFDILDCVEPNCNQNSNNNNYNNNEDELEFSNDLTHNYVGRKRHGGGGFTNELLRPATATQIRNSKNDNTVHTKGIRPKTCYSSTKINARLMRNRNTSKDVGDDSAKLAERYQLGRSATNNERRNSLELRRLRSAPALSYGAELSNRQWQQEMNLDKHAKARTSPSLNISTGSSIDMKIEQDSLRARHASVKRVTRSLNTVAISSVDLQVLDRRMPMASMFHLPPIPPNTTCSSPPPT